MSASRTSRSAWWVATPVSLVLLAGCSSQASDDESSAAEGAAAGTEVDLGQTDLGDVLVGADAMTLYMFDKDAQGEPSTCYDDCATAWPPLLTEGDPAAGDGVDAAKLGTAERTDGTLQVTYDGWPLYYWAQDSAAGDTTGQGVNEVWWVLGADGAPIRG